MSDDGEGTNPSSTFGGGRIVGFSDGVFAVLITILALGLSVPSHPTFDAAVKDLPQLLAFALSFVFLGIYWNNHHHLFRVTHQISGGVMWANMNLLFWLALVPVCTGWIARDPSRAVPAAFYGADAALAGIVYGILVRVIIHANGRTSAIARAIGSDLKGNLSVALYLLAIPFTALSAYLAYGIYVTVAIIWLIPDRRITRELRRSPS